ncbi:hypothetical protein [Shewanella sp. YLB-07]|uniref:hypothetical protein n=1 Tax=Shewanella sp. YLB-07 TaxID=2601268 RepID=UPI00128AE1CE|nr:hypothetical protein [Shewanella sp. YLB-07]MPY24052.1 hypothetical protein [Shewanella sp. YLB-07]
MINLFILTGALLQTSTLRLNLQAPPFVFAQLSVIPGALVEENISEGTRFSPNLHSGLVLEIQSSLDEQFNMMVTSLDAELANGSTESNSASLRTTQIPPYPYILQTD